MRSRPFQDRLSVSVPVKSKKKSKSDQPEALPRIPKNSKQRNNHNSLLLFLSAMRIWKNQLDISFMEQRSLHWSVMGRSWSRTWCNFVVMDRLKKKNSKNDRLRDLWGRFCWFLSAILVFPSSILDDASPNSLEKQFSKIAILLSGRVTSRRVFLPESSRFEGGSPAELASQSR